MTCLRQLYKEDLEIVMKWRMRPDITKYMYTDPVLTMEKQLAWFEASKLDKKNIHFIIEYNKQPIGVLNITDIDKDNKKCSWGYYIAVQEKRSLKLALALEWNVYDFVFYTLELNKLVGEVFAFNKAVVRIHQMCGSRIEGERKNHILKNGKYYDIIETGICKEEWEQIRYKYDYEKIPFFYNSQIL